MPIDRSTLDRLVAQGRAKGQLTNEDLAAALPIASMDADDIALVVVHLEEAGIAVELDESLLTGQPSRPPEATRHVEFVSPDSLAERPSPARPHLSAGAPSASEARPGDVPASGSGPSVHRAVVLAGLAVVALLVLAILLMRG
jgi:hypothetical protein